MRTRTSGWRLALTVALALLVATPRGSAGEWTNWQWINPLPQGNLLFDSCHGMGITVAVGTSGTILLSEDGESWEIVRSGHPNFLRSVAWTGERFIAVGSVGYGGIVLSSPDGRQWTERDDGGVGRLYSVHWNGAQVLAVGGGRHTLTSADGITWTRHELAEELFRPGMDDVAWNGSRYVSVGKDYDDLMGQPAAFVSDDGASWSLIDMAGLEVGGYSAITYGLGRFVATAIRGDGLSIFMLSDDGLSWTQAPAEAPGYLYDITYENGQFAAVSWEFFATSVNGRGWSVYRGEFDEHLHKVAWIGDRYLLLGYNAFMTTTVDGTSFMPIGSRFIPGNSGPIEDMVLGGNGYVGVSSDAVIMSSPDGIDWEVQLDTVGRFLSVRWFENEYWVVGSYGQILSSHDGVAWEVRNTGYDIAFFDIASNGSLLAAVGSGSSGTPLIATSHDGHAWSYHEFDDLQELFLWAVAWTDDRFVATGEYGLVLTSNDGVSWTASRIADDIAVRSLAWNGQRIVGVGGVFYTGGGLIATSQDGLTWDQLIVHDDSLTNVTWTGSRFVAVGDGWMFTSADGVNWTQERPGYGAWPRCVAGDRSEILVAGDQGIILHANHVSAVPRRGGPRVGPPDGGQPIVSDGGLRALAEEH